MNEFCNCDKIVIQYLIDCGQTSTIWVPTTRSRQRILTEQDFRFAQDSLLLLLCFDFQKGLCHLDHLKVVGKNMIFLYFLFEM